MKRTPDPAPVNPGPKLLPANGLDHGPTCGERVPCPVHGQPFGPHFLPAERQVRQNVIVVLAHDCGGRWIEAAA